RGGIQLTPVDAPMRTIRAEAAEGGPINTIVWHPSGRRLFTGGYDGHVRAWEFDRSRWPTPLRCILAIPAAHGPVKSLAWSAAAGLLLAGSSDGSLSAWRGGQQVWRARRS